MSYLTTGSTANQIVHKQSSDISLAGVTKLTIMLKFRTPTRVYATNYLMSGRAANETLSGGPSIAAGATRNILFRIRTLGTGGGSTTVTVPYTDDAINTCFLEADITTQLLTAYVNGVAETPVAIGDAWDDANFRLRLQGGAIDGDNFEMYEAAYWIDHAVESSQVSAYQSGSDLTALATPPTEIFRLNGTEGTLADPLTAENDSPARDLIQIQGATIAPDRPVFGVPSTTPPPDVPVGYTRYETDIASADTTSEGSVFFGIAVEDGMLFDVESDIIVLGEVGERNGHLIVDSPRTTTVYYYYPSNGDYLSEEFVFNFNESSIESPIYRSMNSNADGIKIGIEYGIVYPINLGVCSEV